MTRPGDRSPGASEAVRAIPTLMHESLVRALVTILGADSVSTDPERCDLATQDLFDWPGRTPALVVVRPRSIDELSAVLARLDASGTPVVARGGGMSYTAGAVPAIPAAVIDLTGMASIEVHPDDLYAVVGAGCTWEALAAALKPHRLRATQPNPISGSVSTIGGAASQNVPGGMDGISGLTVLLADGTVVRTGSGGLHPHARGLRHAGPDLTGLFLGDCGAFGVKAEVVLRLAREPAAAFASFAFDDADTMLAATTTLLRERLVTRVFSLDQSRSQSASEVSPREAANIVGAVARRAGSFGQAVRDVAQLAGARRALSNASWSLHCVVEAPTEALADAQLALARQLCAARGREIDNVLPKTLRAKPYSIRGFVGPDGERWVPVHGIVPLGRARDCMAALQAHFATHQAALEALRITHSWMISSIGAYITIEPMLYWRDALSALHLQHLSERNRARFGGFPADPAARERVRILRRDLLDIMDRHDAIHAQVGRYYPYAEHMDPASRTLVDRIKRVLDPNAILNPGVLQAPARPGGPQ